jgi:MFS family permease
VHRSISSLYTPHALVNLVFAIPTGRWLESRPVNKAVFWSSVIYRIGFLLWVPLPWIFGANNEGQIWTLIIITLLMGIPYTALGLGFNALFASAVPADWWATVAGIRNVVLSITFIASSLVSGYVLNSVPFPLGYQIVFTIGFIGAALSSLHLFFVRPLSVSAQPERNSTPDAASIGHPKHKRDWRSVIRIDVWHTPFKAVLLALLAFHLAQYLAIPVFPLFYVHALNLTDQNIGIGTALFYLTVLIGSTQLNRIVQRMGHKAVTGFGVIGMGAYPALLALSSQVWHYYAVSFVGGLTWSLVGGAYANYLLENIPAHDRPAHLAWYTIILNACILAGSLIGPSLANHLGLATALLLFGLLRFLAGFSILKWG